MTSHSTNSDNFSPGFFSPPVSVERAPLLPCGWIVSPSHPLSFKVSCNGVQAIKWSQGIWFLHAPSSSCFCPSRIHHFAVLLQSLLLFFTARIEILEAAIRRFPLNRFISFLASSTAERTLAHFLITFQQSFLGFSTQYCTFFTNTLTQHTLCNVGFCCQRFGNLDVCQVCEQAEDGLRLLLQHSNDRFPDFAFLCENLKHKLFLSCLLEETWVPRLVAFSDVLKRALRVPPARAMRVFFFTAGSWDIIQIQFHVFDHAKACLEKNIITCSLAQSSISCRSVTTGRSIKPASVPRNVLTVESQLWFAPLLQRDL